MPRFDGTGPQGRGSGTGRGMGRCRATNSPVQPNTRIGDAGNYPGGAGQVMGRGQGKGMGRGRSGNNGSGGSNR